LPSTQRVKGTSSTQSRKSPKRKARLEGGFSWKYAASYLGKGIDKALPAPRSAIHRVSPAGSTPVGVLSPSLSTVTLALSPLTVIAEIFPLPFSATRSLPLAAPIP